MVGIIFDLIIIAIIGITVLLSAKKGFVRVLIEVIGLIAAIIIAFSISTPLSEMTYDRIIEPPILSAVTNSVDFAAGDTAENVIEETFNALPDWIENNLDKIGISKESIDKCIIENIGSGAYIAARNASQNAIRPVVIELLRLIYLVLISIILILIVKLLAVSVNKLFSFSIVGKLNRTLGGIVGIPKGIIFAMVFCFIISVIIGFTENGFLIFTEEAISESRLFSIITFNAI